MKYWIVRHPCKLSGKQQGKGMRYEYIVAIRVSIGNHHTVEHSLTEATIILTD